MTPTFDNVDIDDNGHGILIGLSCVECRAEIVARFGIAGPWVYSLTCPECMEDLIEWAA